MCEENNEEEKIIEVGPTFYPSRGIGESQFDKNVIFGGEHPKGEEIEGRCVRGKYLGGKNNWI